MFYSFQKFCTPAVVPLMVCFCAFAGSLSAENSSILGPKEPHYQPIPEGENAKNADVTGMPESILLDAPVEKSAPLGGHTGTNSEIGTESDALAIPSSNQPTEDSQQEAALLESPSNETANSPLADLSTELISQDESLPEAEAEVQTDEKSTESTEGWNPLSVNSSEDEAALSSPASSNPLSSNESGLSTDSLPMESTTSAPAANSSENSSLLSNEPQTDPSAGFPSPEPPIVPGAGTGPQSENLYQDPPAAAVQTLPTQNPTVSPSLDTQSDSTPTESLPASNAAGISSPASTLDSPVSNSAPKHQKTASSKISSSRKLLERLCPSQEVILEDVEAIDLRTFLNGPGVRFNSSKTKEAVSTYWTASVFRSEVNYWQTRLECIEKLKNTISAADASLCEAALTSAQASLNGARIALRANAMELANLAGFTREVTAKTLPHAGTYETRYEYYRQALPHQAALLAYTSGLVELHREQLTAAASAYLSAENLLNLELKQNEKLASILQAWDVLNERRRVFFDVLLTYNEDILNYVQIVSQKSGSALVPLLVSSDSEVKLKGYQPSSKAPSLPNQVSPASSGTDDGNAVSPVSTNLVPNSVPAAETVPSAVPSAVQEGGIPAPSLQNSDTPKTFAAPTDTSQAVPETVGGDYVEIEPVPVVPGASSGVPAIETPPPGSEFKPIGGETGVDTNPILNVPTSNSGVGIFHSPQNRLLTHRTAKPEMPSVLVSGNSLQTSTGAGTVSAPSSDLKEISLLLVLERSLPNQRRQAVESYWKFAFYQNYVKSLKHQQGILTASSRKVLADALTQPNQKLGIRTELESLILKTELLGIQAEEWRAYSRLLTLMQLVPSWPSTFPQAVTKLKEDSFRINLDRFTPGSPQELQTLPAARHLYFCAQELPKAQENLQKVSQHVEPVQNLAETETFKKIQTASFEELTILYESLKNARKTKLKYLELLHSVNVFFTSCILADSSAQVSVRELHEVLSN